MSRIGMKFLVWNVHGVYVKTIEANSPEHALALATGGGVTYPMVQCKIDRTENKNPKNEFIQLWT